MGKSLTLGVLALALIIGVTFVSFGAEWSTTVFVAVIVGRLALVAVPLGALAQILVRRGPLPFWGAAFLALMALLVQSLVLHAPRLPLGAAEALLWLAAVALSASLIDLGATLVRAIMPRPRAGEELTTGAGEAQERH